MPKKPMDLSNILKGLYGSLLLFLMFFNIKDSFDLSWELLLNTSITALAIVSFLFGAITLATNVLLNYMTLALRTTLQKYTTTDYNNIVQFWVQANNYSKDKLLFFGGVLSIFCLIKQVIV